MSSSPRDYCSGSDDLWCLLTAVRLAHSVAEIANQSRDGSSAAVTETTDFRASSAYDLLMDSLDGLNESDTDFETRMFQLLANRRPLNSLQVSDGFKSAVDGMNLYVTPIIIAVGVVGNALSLAVFSLTHLRRLSSSVYLSTLSVADILFLLALIIVWLQRIDVDLFARDGWCQSVLYATRVSEFLASWYVVSFTAERYVTVYCPLRKDSYCTKRRARLIVSSITVVAALFYLPTFWTYDVVLIGPRAACSPLPRHHYVITAHTSVDLLASCLVPSIAVVALNVRIIAKIHRYQQVTLDAARIASNFTAAAAGGAAVVPAAAMCNTTMRRRSMVQTSMSASGSMHIKFNTVVSVNHLQPSILPVGQQPMSKRPSSASQQHKLEQVLMTLPQRGGPSVAQGHDPSANALPLQSAAVSSTAVNRRLIRGQSQLRTARMLLVLSSVIVLLNLPAHVFRVQAVVHHLVGGLARAHRDRFTWQELFQLIQFTNFAVNFFVYSLCGRQFRTGLARLCSRQRVRCKRCASRLACCRRTCCCCCCCCCRRRTSRRGHRHQSSRTCCRRGHERAAEQHDDDAQAGHRNTRGNRRFKK